MSSKLRRIGTIIKLIANNPGITLTRLHDRLSRSGIEITERTLAKDIASLKNDYGLLSKEGRLRKGYVLKDLATLSSVELNLVLDALHLLGSRMDDAEAEAAMERLVELNKSLSAMPAPRIRTVRHRNILKKDLKYKEHLAFLYEAIRSRRALLYSYKTPRLEKEEELTGYPLVMVFHERGWYCIVRALESKIYNARRIDRIKALRFVDEYEENLDAIEDIKEANYLINCGWGMTFPGSLAEAEAAERQPPVVARFDRTVASYILEATERHPRGKISPVKDGTGEVEFSIKLSDPREFVSWIRSFGSKAKIVSPASLVEKERVESRRMFKMYD
ncbi:MAG: WYL domain-containing protein [Candidatus Obscuribacterales bacterium]|nr:WYL domain-containing protein [Candidatus Obscuribacterales bacterium]